jgi:hypothetical protein
MKLFGLLSALLLTGALIMPLAAQTETTKDVRKVVRDQAYIDRQKRQRDRAAVNGNLAKAARKNRNAQVAKVKRDENVRDVGKDVQAQK